MNTHITIDGHPMQVTVRTDATSDDYAQVLTVMQQVLAEHSDAPAPQYTPQVPLQIQAPQAPAKPMAQSVAQPGPSLMMQWCDVDKVNMKQRDRHGEYWDSHKVGDSWCRGEGEAG